MARIRTIKPQFFRHRKLFLAEQQSGMPLRLAFEGLWIVADREGRFRWEPDELKLDCLPYDEVDFAEVLNALAQHGFIHRYEVNGDSYGHIPSWHKHQVINHKEAKSQLPAPPSDPPEGPGGDNRPRSPTSPTPGNSRVDPGKPATSPGIPSVEGEGNKEGKGRGKEGEGEGPSPSRELANEFRSIQEGQQPIDLITSRFAEPLRSGLLQEAEIRTEIHNPNRDRSEACWDLINRLKESKRGQKQPSRPVGTTRLGATEAQLRRLEERDGSAANANQTRAPARPPNAT